MIKSKISNLFKLTSLILRKQHFFTKDKDLQINPHFKPAANVQDFFNRLAIDHRISSQSYRIRECVFCTKPHYNQLTNLYTLNVHKTNGSFYCHRCGVKGSWIQLKARYLNTEATDIGSLMSDQFGQNIVRPAQMPISETEYFYYLSNLKKKEYQNVLQQLHYYGIKNQTLDKYWIGAGVQSFPNSNGKNVQLKCIYFPIYQINKKKIQKAQQVNANANIETILIKYKAQAIFDKNGKFIRHYPQGGKTGFFGLNTISSKDKIIVLTQGQLNAMAVNQQTGYPAISLPQGTSSLTQQLLPQLNQFQKIVIWLDNDQAGRLGQDKIIYKLGNSRTYVVRTHEFPAMKNALDFLKTAPQRMKQVIQKSKTKPGENIISFADIQQQIKNRIFRHEQYMGIKINWLPFFNKKVKGVRMQELSIVSGPTGCGKTTFLSQITLDLCKKKIPVLWGSFQIKNQMLITNMIIQYSGINLFQNKDKFDHVSQQFKNLPLYWLSFHGSNDVQKVLASIQYSIQKHNISVVVLDTLQFLLSDQAQGYKKFELQDRVLSRLRKMATNYNVHIIIVIHPRKTEDNTDIQIQSIYGTSKSTQQADNVWILQTRQNFRIFDIKKNRFDGDIGKVAIGFDKNNKSFFQFKRNQLSQIYSNEATIDQIIQKRYAQAKQKGISPHQNQNESENQQNSTHDDFINQSRKTKTT